MDPANGQCEQGPRHVPGNLLVRWAIAWLVQGDPLAVVSVAEIYWERGERGLGAMNEPYRGESLCVLGERQIVG